MFSIVANMLTSLPLKLVQITCPLETALSQTLRFGYNCSSISAHASQHRKHTILLDVANPDHKAESMPVALTQGKKILYTV
jgi:hypothetical protein